MENIDTKAYVGKDISEVEQLLDEKGQPHRVMWQDGEAFFGTMDFRPDRLNFHVEDGKIIEAYTG